MHTVHTHTRQISCILHIKCAIQSIVCCNRIDCRFHFKSAIENVLRFLSIFSGMFVVSLKKKRDLLKSISTVHFILLFIVAIFVYCSIDFLWQNETKKFPSLQTISVEIALMAPD